MFSSYFKGIWRDRYVLWSLVNRDLQQKYRRSKLGVLWSVITPTGLAIIIGLIYSILFSSEPKEFIPLLFAGLNPWNFLANTAAIATVSFMSAESYLKQSAVNAQIYPLRCVLVCFVDLLYSMMAFIVIYLFLRPNYFNVKMLLVIPGLIIIFVFMVGIANIVSVVNLNIRDYQQFQGLMLQGLFYITPVIYSKEMMADKGVAYVYEWNPLYYIVEIVKTPLQGREILELKVYIIATMLALAVFLYGIYIVMREKSIIALKL